MTPLPRRLFIKKSRSSLLPFPASIESLLSFLYLEDFAALVVAALGAGMVGQLAFVAIRTLGESGGSQRVVRAALGGAGLGMAPLRIRHDRFLSIRPLISRRLPARRLFGLVLLLRLDLAAQV